MLHSYQTKVDLGHCCGPQPSSYVCVLWYMYTLNCNFENHFDWTSGEIENEIWPADNAEKDTRTAFQRLVKFNVKKTVARKPLTKRSLKLALEFNSLRRGDTYICVCEVKYTRFVLYRFCTKPLPEPMMSCCELGLKEQISVTFWLKHEHFMLKNTFENVVCKTSVILPGPNKPAWCRHQMETFSALLALCAGNSPVTGEFPSQRPLARSFDVFFVRLE